MIWTNKRERMTIYSTNNLKEIYTGYHIKDDGSCRGIREFWVHDGQYSQDELLNAIKDSLGLWLRIYLTHDEGYIWFTYELKCGGGIEYINNPDEFEMGVSLQHLKRINRLINREHVELVEEMKRLERAYKYATQSPTVKHLKPEHKEVLDELKDE